MCCILDSRFTAIVGIYYKRNVTDGKDLIRHHDRARSSNSRIELRSKGHRDAGTLLGYHSINVTALFYTTWDA